MSQLQGAARAQPAARSVAGAWKLPTDSLTPHSLVSPEYVHITAQSTAPLTRSPQRRRPVRWANARTKLHWPAGRVCSAAVVRASADEKSSRRAVLSLAAGEFPHVRPLGHTHEVLPPTPIGDRASQFPPTSTHLNATGRMRVSDFHWKVLAALMAERFGAGVQLRSPPSPRARRRPVTRTPRRSPPTRLA
jgi:hypothetical protein